MSAAKQEAELLHRITTGDRAALGELYAQNAGWLMVRLERRCGDSEMADQALQDTFVAVWKNAGSYRGEGDVGGWLWGIAVRRLIDLLRKTRPAAARPVAPLVPSAEQVVMDRRLSGPLAQAVAGLDADVRDVFLLAHVDELTTKEIANLRQIPQGTVKTRLSRARRTLRANLTNTAGDAA